ncbi:FG-GAP repeat domain-containing protein [Acidicapsa acidisoli]|uniref:FG-GAP repeat domain-containing protein n=1 Tax=Acidicapsa acidisoli TaxID=1615681 RepID=UPI0021E0BBF8|nr:VCBS repeat-containing protein [Acidicapsa acidisoli]
MTRAWLRFLPLLLLIPAQNGVPQKAASTTTLQSNSSTLQLPGSLTLSATVAPPTATGGMPSGDVQFFTNSTSLLGTAALKALPATEHFSAPPLTGNFGNQPFGLFTLPSSTSKYSILGLLDYTAYNPTTGTTYPELTIYTGKWPTLFLTPDVYQLTNSGITASYPGVDAFATGDFNHDGITDVLIHGFNNTDTTSFGNEYYVLPGKAGGTYDPTTSVISPDKSGITCNCSNPTEVITVDDFNGDGYPDVAYTANGPGSGGTVGVALNAGAASPGSFPTFLTAPPITPTVKGETFQSTAIASGHFTSSGYPDIAVAGSPTTDGDGYVALYLNQGPSKGIITFAVPVLFDAGLQPSAIAVGDFRANGLMDVVVTNVVPGTQTGAVQVLFGDGKGNLTTSSTVAVGVELASVSVADFNNDGYPDILAVGFDGSLNLLLNDATGHFKSTLSISGSTVGSLSAIGDFNADGLADIAEITQSPQGEGSASTVLGFFNSASSQAILATAAQTLPAGTDALTAVFPSDVNFNTSTSEPVSVTVTQTASTLTWAQPGVMEYGAPLSATQLNAVSSVPGAITYAPAAGTVLRPGPNTVTATFAPTDAFDYTGATATQTITVAAPTLIGISPSSAKLGDPSTTIAVNGQGFVQGAVVEWNGSALATTWMSLNQLTAVVPASLLTATGTGTITAVDANKIAVTGSQVFTVIASPAAASVTAPSTAEAGQGSSVTLTVNPYPVAVTATLTLSFTPDPPNTVGDPAVLFPNNTTTEVIQIPANSSAPIPAVDFSTGSTAGTITLTITLTASGVDITPASLVPVVVTVPAASPVINSVTLTRNGNDITIAILGLSSTRDMTQAEFQFTPASGASLKTTNLTVDLTAPFTTWYQSSNSDSFGTTFLYTQPFTLSSDATSVGGVTVTLTNSQGASQPANAQ